MTRSAVNPSVDDAGGSASADDQREPGLRINPVYIPTTIGDRL